MSIKLNGATNGSIQINVPDAIGSDLNVTLPATAGEVAVKDSSGNLELTSVNSLNFPTAGALSNRNLIINGAMEVAQRGTTGTSQNGNNNQVVDRFKGTIGTSPAVITHSQETTGAPGGFQNWLKVVVTTADTSIGATDYGSISQMIEGYNFAHVNYGTSNAQEVTVSFKFKTNKAGTYCMIHRNLPGDRNYLHEFTPVADGNWQTITYTVPGDTTGTWNKTNGIGWRWELTIANGTSFQSPTVGSWFSGTFYHSTPNQVNFLDSTSNELGITGVQVEVGSKSTPFEHKSYGQTLAKCQRYTQVYRWTSQYQHICQGIIANGYTIQNELPLASTMRAQPSCTISNIAHFRLNDYRGHDQDANSFLGIENSSVTPNVAKISFGKATSDMDAGRAGYMNVSTSAGGNCSITFSAEL